MHNNLISILSWRVNRCTVPQEMKPALTTVVREKPAWPSRPPISRRSTKGEIWGANPCNYTSTTHHYSPPSLHLLLTEQRSISANWMEDRSSNSVSPANMTPMKGASGLRTLRTSFITPGRLFTQWRLKISHWLSFFTTSSKQSSTNQCWIVKMLTSSCSQQDQMYHL